MVQQKWKVEAVDPTIKPRYQRVSERTHQVKDVGALFKQDYKSVVTARKAVSRLRKKYPNAVIEMRRYEFDTFAWFQRGEAVRWEPE